MSKQTQTLEMPSLAVNAPKFHADFEEFYQSNREWTDTVVTETAPGALPLITYKRLARSALNFDTVATDVMTRKGLPVIITEGQQDNELNAVTPHFGERKLSSVDKRLQFFSRCATNPYPAIADHFSSVDILVSSHEPWYRQLLPRNFANPDEIAPRLLMSRILSECLEPNHGEISNDQANRRILQYEHHAQEGITPLHIEEYRKLVERAVLLALD